MTDPFTALQSAAATAVTEGQRLQQVTNALTQQLAADQATIAQQAALIAQLEAGQQTGTVFGFDVSNLGTDSKLTEQQKLDSHRSLLGAGDAQHVREFFNPGQTLTWNTPRLNALGPGDSVVISMKDHPARNGFAAFDKNRPDKFRQRPGQVIYAYHHECEAEWAKATNKAAWIADYTSAYQALADGLVANGTGTQHDVVKILLWYSQVIASATKGSWDTFHAGQNFGLLGMDCYHYQAWLNRTSGGKPVGRYATPDELFGPLVAMKSSGLDVCAPEWGGTLANSDTDGSARAKAITDGGAYLKQHGVVWANWWCAQGSPGRNHHLEQAASNVAAYKGL